MQQMRIYEKSVAFPIFSLPHVNFEMRGPKPPKYATEHNQRQYNVQYRDIFDCMAIYLCFLINSSFDADDVSG